MILYSIMQSTTENTYTLYIKAAEALEAAPPGERPRATLRQQRPLAAAAGSPALPALPAPQLLGRPDFSHS